MAGYDISLSLLHVLCLHVYARITMWVSYRSKPILLRQALWIIEFSFIGKSKCFFSFTSYILLVILFMETNYSFTSFSFFFRIFRQTRLHSIWHPRSNIRHGSFIFLFGFWFSRCLLAANFSETYPNIS
jgi:hypothetical protein